MLTCVQGQSSRLSKDVNIFKSGYIPSPPDARDKPFDLVKLTLETKARTGAGQEHVITEYTPISDQSSLSSCVANAVGDLIEIVIGLEDPTNVVQISRLHLYWNSRSYTRDTDKDAGTYIRNAIDSLRVQGVCREETWPYDVSKVFAQPPIRAYQESLDNKIDSYHRLFGIGDARLDAVETAIRADHPVTIATAVDNAFLAYRGGEKVIVKPSSWMGYHAMIIVGVRFNVRGEREFLLRNSWGKTWGDDGHAWVNADYVGWTETDDLWVVDRVPSLVF